MIRRISCLLIGLSCFLMVLSPLSGAELPLLTPQKVLELAQNHSPQLKASQQRLLQAEQKIAQARSDQLPKVYLSFSGMWQGEDGEIPAMVKVQGQDVMTGAPVMGVGQGVALNSFREAYYGALGFQWLLYSSGAVENLVNAKKFARDGVAAQEQRVLQAIEHSALQAYYGVLRAGAKLGVAQELLNLAQQHLVKVKALYTHGVIARSDELRTQVNVADGELAVIACTNALELSWQALERIVGTPLRNHYKLPEPSLSQDRRAELPRHAEPRRLEVMALETLKKSALASARAAAGSTGPKLIASGEVFTMGREFWPDEKDDWKLSLTLRWDLFDGGLGRAKIREAKAAAAEIDARTEDLYRQIELEISSATLNLKTASQRMEVAARQIRSAEEDYRIALLRYQSSVGTNLDVLDARAGLSKARNQLVDAFYDRQGALADYYFAMGLDQNLSLVEAPKE